VSGWGSEANSDGAGPAPDLSVWRPWAGSVLEVREGLSTVIRDSVWSCFVQKVQW